MLGELLLTRRGVSSCSVKYMSSGCVATAHEMVSILVAINIQSKNKQKHIRKRVDYGNDEIPATSHGNGLLPPVKLDGCIGICNAEITALHANSSPPRTNCDTIVVVMNMFGGGHE